MPGTIGGEHQDRGLGQQSTAMVFGAQRHALHPGLGRTRQAVMQRQARIEHRPVGSQKLAQRKILREHLGKVGRALLHHALHVAALVEDAAQVRRVVAVARCAAFDLFERWQALQHRAVRLDGAQAPPLGFASPDNVREAQIVLPAHPTILAYTDGVTEAQDVNRALYSGARLERVLATTPASGAKAVVDFVREDVRRFAAGAEQADDITLLAVRWLGPKSAE